MKKIYLCGHTGSVNRGCEAILRSTACILKECGITDITAMTFDKDYDESLELNQVLNLVSYPKRNIVIRVLGNLTRRLFKAGIWSSKFFYYEFFKTMKNKKESIVFNVGGDTYCYGDPYISYALNEVAKENKIQNIFWGCSVEEVALNNRRMKKDINKYSAIVVRESLSQEILNKIVDDPEKIILACDPAFQLPIKETKLPIYFKDKNTVGINLSPLVFSDYKNEDDLMYKNIQCLIGYILENTEMNICLIPHVYNILNHTQDIDVLSRIYEKYKDTKRVGIIDRELSCSELKYIISKCRFFIGARTHATIAAYSTSVPAIALSYSIKSRGIAKDLFGTEEGYVVSWKNIKTNDDIKEIFVNTLIKHEKSIKKRYVDILPEYKQSILNAVKKVL